jgi:hypothetical protein
MDASVRLRIDALPPALREPLEMAEVVVLDLARRVAEGIASPRDLEDAREIFRQIQGYARAYLRDEVERDLFAFPRTTRPVAPAAH